MSKHQLPREQAAIEHHLERVASARAVQALRPPLVADLEQWVREAGNVEERAQRARVVAQARHEQTLAAEKERVCVF